MPKISQGYKNITVNLPSYDDSELVLKTNISVEDLSEVDKFEGFEHSTALVERLLISWNFQDEEGNLLPITSESIKKLPVKDLTFLFEQITPYLQKKTVSEKTP